MVNPRFVRCPDYSPRFLEWLLAVALLLPTAGVLAQQPRSQPGPQTTQAQAPTPESAGVTLSEGARRARTRRDPFRSLLVRLEDLQAAQALPPGKRGLMVGQIRVDGIVVTPEDRIAVVTVPHRDRAYFLREQDELYNGYVLEIHDDFVVFKERAMDAFGKTYEREVVKQIYPAAGATR